MDVRNTLSLVLTVLLFCVTRASAYIPASPTNDTQAAIQAGLNVTDVSQLHLQWYPNGSYWSTVSYQLVGADSDGFTQGAIVHFSEVNITNATTTTPWIALVSCDFNATNASQEDDIFTLARDRGAVSALLYSKYSQACIINPAYADPASFDQVMDIFSTQSLTSATLVDYQFGQSGPQNESMYGVFDAQLLNSSSSVVNATIQTNTPAAPGYLFATLRAYNATVGNNNTGSSNGTSTTNNSNGGGSSNTGLAMIILYAITGCVSALFCVVIISGAIRAIRHPERYGPRAGTQQEGGFGGPSQSRARGLTRAFIDTFPVIKFGQNADESDTSNIGRRPDKDVEAHPDGHVDSNSGHPAVEMTDWEAPNENSQKVDEESRPSNVAPHQEHEPPMSRQDSDDASQPQAGGSNIVPLPRSRARPAQTPAIREEVQLGAIGRETCPICIVDFEEGDDLRLLPCEGKHKFHQQCVDPWLLELSSSCPICREDFQALEAMMSGGVDDGANYHGYMSSHSGHRDSGVQGNRFSRYLRIARRRRDRERDDYDPTDPYMPVAPETSA